ncbi:MAG TPA: hypothetical protein VJT83_09835, partial [Chitinophagaceae bacterium]|nr:hypothetical protein [Chitinophagaceae bacterium]
MKVTALLLRKLFSLVLLCAIASSAFAQTTPTLTTDEPDYAPGSTVLITGTGFAPGESVKIQVIHSDKLPGDDLNPEHQPWYINADAQGNISTTWYVPLYGDEVGATLLVL